jgi:hypothetical protein
VEVKQKRAARKPAHTIWGDIDLSAMAAEARREAHQSPVRSSEVLWVSKNGTDIIGFFGEFSNNSDLFGKSSSRPVSIWAGTKPKKTGQGQSALSGLS